MLDGDAAPGYLAVGGFCGGRGGCWGDLVRDFVIVSLQDRAWSAKIVGKPGVQRCLRASG